MAIMNIYLIGVGGQGIGLLAEILMRAADYADLNVKAVDTHGLAQRGGIVVSQIRMGDTVHSPLIREGEADIAIALERHEALRALNSHLRVGGTLVYYNTVWQPLEVRLNEAEEVSEDVISRECGKRDINEIKVFKSNLEDARMQNIVLLAAIDKKNLVPAIETKDHIRAMEDLMEGRRLENNMRLFREERGGDRNCNSNMMS